MFRKTALTVVTVATLSTILGGCASNQSANTYTTINAQKKLVVTHGVIVSLRDVTLENSSGAGGAAGAGVGATAGSMAGSGYRSGIAGMIVGAVVGGVGGMIADKAVNSNEGWEITYKCDEDGREYAVTQAKKGSEDLKVGDHVRVLDNGFTSRVVRG